MAERRRAGPEQRAVRAAWRLGLVACLLSAAAAPAAPTAPEPAPADASWHIVRPGDTLESLAQRYLGLPSLWPVLHRLNPWVQNPHRIYPGQRLRIPLDRMTAAPSARVEKLQQHVEERPLPVDWTAANRGDLLIDRDGVRTYERSSAELVFTDGTRIVASENSLLFVRTPEARPTRPDRGVEIVEGEAELSGAGIPAGRPQIEIVLGQAAARAKPNPEGAVHGRAARAGSADRSRFMIYDGEAAVASAGKTVTLAAGSGTLLAPHAPPSPPEALLPAPTGLAPAAGGELLRAAPSLAWQPVAGAGSYVAEVCADAGCGQVLARGRDLAAPAFTPAIELPETFHWRVWAVATSGLDGFPSAAQTVTVVDRPADATPPAGRAEIVAPAVENGGTVWYDERARLTVEASDAGSGVARMAGTLDGAERDESALRGPWPGGRHRLAIAAIDGAGNRGELGELAFAIDDAAPRLEITRPSTAAILGGKTRSFRGLAHADWSRDGGWRIWAWELYRKFWLLDARVWRRGFARALPVKLRLDPDGAAVELVVTRDRPFADEAAADWRRGDVVRIAAVDDGCGLADFVVGRSADGSTVTVEATDRLGHTSELTWRVRR